ncbi:IS4 family transposase [Deinococcus cellulosilyticus]|uniref:IS4 family transposase n=1 Tax=Deinococcus cellulosilyticus TaxID=401558 RepID=UPI0011BF0121|nr:IS4 family transposase [Deinococcus cellulosilyticus]
MSYTPSGSNQHTLTRPLREHFPYRKNHLDTLGHVLQATLEGKHVIQQSIADRLPGEAQNPSKLRRVERFFSTHPLSQHHTATYLLNSLPDNEKLTFILDRTNWDLGQTPINILMLAVLQPSTNTALPLCWTTLNHSGNSSTKARVDLLEALFHMLPIERIGMLLADREFIGEPWLTFLVEHEVPFTLRIRENMHLDDIQAKVWFEDLRSSEVSEVVHDVLLAGLPVWTQATLSPEGERVIVISSVSDELLLERYRKRFRIECLFKNMKSLGFRLENTHMTDPRHLERLVCLLAVVFVWAVKLGERVHIRKKNHGRLARSVFRVGISLLLELFRKPLQALLDGLQLLFPRRCSPGILKLQNW